MVTTTELPWYERGPDGTSTGRAWATEDQARAEVAPGCTVHQETSALAGEPSFGTTRYTRPAPSPVKVDVYLDGAREPHHGLLTVEQDEYLSEWSLKVADAPPHGWTTEVRIQRAGATLVGRAEYAGDESDVKHQWLLLTGIGPLSKVEPQL